MYHLTITIDHINITMYYINIIMYHMIIAQCTIYFNHNDQTICISISQCTVQLQGSILFMVKLHVGDLESASKNQLDVAWLATRLLFYFSTPYSLRTVTKIKQERTNQDRTNIGPFFIFYYIVHLSIFLLEIFSIQHSFTTQL